MKECKPPQPNRIGRRAMAPGVGRALCCTHPTAMNTKLTVKLTAALVFASLLTVPVHAKLAWNKKAKAHAAGVTGFISCHSQEKPKKGEPLV